MPYEPIPTELAYIRATQALWEKYYQNSKVVSRRINIDLEVEKENIDAGQTSQTKMIRKKLKTQKQTDYNTRKRFIPSHTTDTPWFMKRGTTDPFYQAGHTNTGAPVVHDDKILKDYIVEATFAELMRALDPKHPKARVVMQNHKIHLMSKAIPGFCPLEDVIQHKHPAIQSGEVFKTGVQNGSIDGLAKSMVLKLWIADRDWHQGNAGLRTNENGSQSVVSIDHGQTLGYHITRGQGTVDYSITPEDWKGLPYRHPSKVFNHLDQISQQMITPYYENGLPTQNTQLLDKRMSQNPYFLNEKNATLLSIALLPEWVLENHCFYCIPDKTIAQAICSELLIRRKAMLDAAFSCDNSFANYVLSPAAALPVLQQTQQNLKAFKLAGGATLTANQKAWSEADAIILNQDTNEQLTRLQEWAKKELAQQYVTHPVVMQQPIEYERIPQAVWDQMGQRLHTAGQPAVLQQGQHIQQFGHPLVQNQPTIAQHTGAPGYNPGYNRR